MAVMVFSSATGAFGAADVEALAVFAHAAAERIDAFQMGRKVSAATLLAEVS
ncbi:hypothetical protein [Mycobacterium sp. NAZ190054]|uniref:hypothetical protein n=1 Tax=Mycobacterium sp. NAZ190054 TaxID=1747766 RepID=UPI0012E35AE3|nr:hypothetical protein [Mycobacterium sp. NAZ190054]